MGMLEEIKDEQKRLGSRLDAIEKLLRKALGKGDDDGVYVKASVLMRKYGVSRSTINSWLYRMQANGYEVEVRRATKNGDRRVHAEQFDRAHAELEAMSQMEAMSQAKVTSKRKEAA